jgi:hypothetical protein
VQGNGLHVRARVVPFRLEPFTAALRLQDVAVLAVRMVGAVAEARCLSRDHEIILDIRAPRRVQRGAVGGYPGS